MTNPTRPANDSKIKLPYFDYLLKILNDGNEAVATSFGRHVHWGYWAQPKSATLTNADFAEAAENLSAEVCLAAKLENKLKVLDVGCGFGGTIAHINERYADMELVGLNIDERQLQRARATVKPLPGNNIVFQQGDACMLPFPDQSFDVVLAVECIFHFPNRRQFFAEAYRVLKPGGHLALSDFVPTRLLQPVARFKMPAWGFYGKCNIDYSVHDYRKLATQTAFTLLTERDITANTLPTYTFLRRLAVQQRVGGKSAMLETLSVELLSRLKLLNYYIYGLQK